MDVLELILSALFGLVIGSFLNVCIYRLPRDLSVVAPRSFCPECGTQLTWTENIPLVSFLALHRRCRHCGQPIGVRYPMVELTTALVFLSAYLKWGLTLEALKWVVFAACLIVLFCTDLEERLLLDEFTIGGAVAGLVCALIVMMPGGLAGVIAPGLGIRWQSALNAILGATLLSLPLWLIGFVWSRVRKREALGLGDVKLLAMIGCFLGPGRGLVAVTVGAVAGAITGLALVVLTKKDARTYELPFGSFLCAAALFITFFPTPEQLSLAVL